MNYKTRAKVEIAAMAFVMLVWSLVCIGVPILIIAALVKFVFFT